MKNLLPILALLLLVGCTSEFDRCIEGQFEIRNWNFDHYDEDTEAKPLGDI